MSDKEKAAWEMPPDKTRLGFSIFYRSLWLVLGVAGLVWGVVLGMTFAGANIIGPSTAMAGTVSMVGLMVTLVVAGSPHQVWRVDGGSQ